jgi:hypothetical protein
MNINVLWSVSVDEFGGIQFMPKLKSIDLFNSTIMNLRDLPVFDTTREVVRCTKFLINRVHDKSLWLDRRYPIHEENIHQVTGLSIEGEDFPKGFRVTVSMARRRGSPIYMRNFINRWGRGGGRGHITKIDPILPDIVKTDFYIIASKIMSYY